MVGAVTGGLWANRSIDERPVEAQWWRQLLDVYRGRLDAVGLGEVANQFAQALGTLIEIVELHQPCAGVRYHGPSGREYVTLHSWCPACCDSRCFDDPGDSHVRPLPDCCVTLEAAIAQLGQLPEGLERAVAEPRRPVRLVDPTWVAPPGPVPVRYFDQPLGGREVPLGRLGPVPAGGTIVFLTNETLSDRS